ncbi:MAG: Stp1/IreP family PP2C-type Ser/Thr phosphatase [Candidatus Cohnella colombiensis]|uniref:Stp1/IreP family PP2C-type Ser/Thr phosphatase n=1 Tax=Candidatus Cohnella colombiensis TaxID=3121368 RepID=A0AA95F0U0_9BACL|nr:MAG: Stp1/IreP family PP2C-type Ser/Thr phosphatase [Cohnella sp.]
MRTALRSHVGKVRQINEDQAWFGQVNGHALAAIVADGMGGHRAGEVASGLTVNSIVESLQNWDNFELGADAIPSLREIIRTANTTVFETASLNEQYHNMGTTVVMAMISQGSGLIGYIGDSRAYRIRSGQLEQLTEDHTLVNELTKSGQLSLEEAAQHPRRNVLTRALGTDPEVAIDVQVIDWQIGDRLLLCSDGLSGMVEDELIQATLEQSELNLEQQAERLIELALEAGGDDNITVIIIADDAGANATGGGTA